MRKAFTRIRGERLFRFKRSVLREGRKITGIHYDCLPGLTIRTLLIDDSADDYKAEWYDSKKSGEWVGD